MKKRIGFIILAALGCVLLLGSLTRDSLAVQPPPVSASSYTVRPVSVAGGNYQLEMGGWMVKGPASGPGYQLEVANPPDGTGTPCCCYSLPCIQKH
jgi:hypothetical protein